MIIDIKCGECKETVMMQLETPEFTELDKEIIKEASKISCSKCKPIDIFFEEMFRR